MDDLVRFAVVPVDELTGMRWIVGRKPDWFWKSFDFAYGPFVWLTRQDMFG